MNDPLPDLSRFEVKKKTKPTTDSQRAAIEQGAAELGISPIDYATAISYESAGTFDPWKKGPVTQYGVHRGTIQYGEPQRRKYGVYQGQSFEEQVTTSNVKYLKDAGVKPGMTFAQIYAAINGGSASRNLNTPEYMIKNGKRVPTGRTIADNIALAERDHRAKVIQRFGFTDGSSTGLPDLSQFELPSIPDLSAYELQTVSPTSNPDRLPDASSVLPTNSPADNPPSIARPLFRPRQYSEDPVIGPEEPSVELPLRGSPRQPVYDNTVLGVVDLDPSLSPAEKIRQAGTAVLGRFGVTPAQVDKWVSDSGEKAFQGDLSSGQVTINAQMLAQIVGPEQARFLVDTELDRINQEASAVPQIIRDEINAVAGWETRLPAFANEGAGHTSEWIAGVTRLLSPEFLAGTEDLTGTIRAYTPNRVYPLLKEHGRVTRSNAEFFNDNTYSTQALRIAGNATSDLPRTIAQTALPGSIVTASSLDMASQAAGRGESPDKIRKEAAKGAILGGIARAAYPVGKGIAQNTGSRVAGGAGALAFTGAATYPTSRAFGATPEQAAKEAVFNTVFAVADAVPVLSKAQTLLKKSVAGSTAQSLPDLRAYESTTHQTAKSISPEEAAQNLKDSKPDVEAALGLGSPKQRTKGELRHNLATAARSFDQARVALDDARKVFASQTPDQNYKFIDAIEHRDSWNPSTRGDLPKGQDEIATTLRQMLDKARDEVRSLGVGALEHYNSTYFPHLWRDPKTVMEMMDKNLKPTNGFLQERKFETFSEGILAGLKPLHDNPVDMALARINDMSRYVAGQKTLKFLKGQGYIKQIKDGDPVPSGFVEIKDTIAGNTSAGYKFYADKGAAKILNNHLSPSWNRNKLYRGVRAVGNFQTQMNLSLSAFHLGNVILDSVTSKLAIGLEQLATGHPLKGLKSTAEAIIPGYSPIQNIIKGDKLLKEWLTPESSNDPAMATIADLFEQAGGRGGLDDFYQTRMFEKMADAAAAGKHLKAIGLSVPAGLDLMSRPIMATIVPRMKAAAFIDLAKQELDRLGPDANPEVIRAAMQQAYDSVENRLGEMTYDNLFWKRAHRDLAMISFQSVGWNLGSVREFAGAVRDTATMPKRILDTATKGQQAEPVLTHRQAYVPAMLLSTAMYGGVIHFLLTGESPAEIKDYFFPRRAKGSEDRMNLPSYTKDLYALYKAPISTTLHKVHPLPRLGFQVATNQDYWSNDIRDADDPGPKQFKDVVEHILKASSSYSAQGLDKLYKRSIKSGQPMSFKDAGLPFIGLSPAPRSVNDDSILWSPAENILKDINRNTRPFKTLYRDLSKTKVLSGPSYEDTPEQLHLVNVLAENLKSGEQVDSQIDAAIRSGVLRPRHRTQVYKTAQNYLEQGVWTLNLDQALEVYEAANEQERKLLYRVLQAKQGEYADTLTPTQIAKLKKLELY